MNPTTNLGYELVFLAIAVLLVFSASYAAWMNLVRHRISAIGLDALILLLFPNKKATLIRNDPRLIKRMGIVVLLIAVGTVWQETSLVIERILPYIH